MKTSFAKLTLVGLIYCVSLSTSAGRLIGLMDNDGVFQGGTRDIVANGSSYLFSNFNSEHRINDEHIPHLPAEFVPRQFVDKEYEEHLATHGINDSFCYQGELTKISAHLGERFTSEFFGIDVHHDDEFSMPENFPHQPYAVEGGHAFLDYLNNKQVPWALVSNGYDNFAIRAWKTTGLLEKRNNAPIVFPSHLESLEHSKPSPRHLETALQQLAVADDEPITVFMLGDSLRSDMQAAFGLAQRHDKYNVHAIYFTKEHPKNKKIDQDLETLSAWELEQPNFKAVICHTFEEVEAYVDSLG